MPRDPLWLRVSQVQSSAGTAPQLFLEGLNGLSGLVSLLLLEPEEFGPCCASKPFCVLLP